MRKESVLIITVVLAVVALASALHYTLQPAECQTFGCFRIYMAACAPAQYVNEEPEASWLYATKKKVKDACEVEVVLLQAKEGDLNLRSFEGHSMLCQYPYGTAAYPDKDMSRCHGLLKEDLQRLVIERIHRYLINNLADVKKTLWNTA